MEKIIYCMVVILFITAILIDAYYPIYTKKDEQYKNTICNTLNVIGFAFLALFQFYLTRFREGFYVVMVALIACIYITYDKLLHP